MVAQSFPAGSLAASDGFSLRKKAFRNSRSSPYARPRQWAPSVPGQQHEPLKRPCGQPDGHRGRHRAKRESVNRALKYLREHNFIQSVKAGGATVYVVNSKVAWQGNRGERYAAFGADVLAIEAEQEQDLIDDPRPLKSVPKLIEGERLLVGNEPIDPPDQGELELP